MARYASFCLIMGPFKGEVPVFARLWPVRVIVTVSFTTGQYGRPSWQQLGFLLSICSKQCGNLKTKVLRLESTRVHFTMVSVSRT